VVVKKNKVKEALEVEDPVELALDFFPWHEEQRRFLFNLANQDHLHHAFILHGLSSLGKFDFACAMSAALL